MTVLGACALVLFAAQMVALVVALARLLWERLWRRSNLDIL